MNNLFLVVVLLWGWIFFFFFPDAVMTVPIIVYFYIDTIRECPSSFSLQG